jgi:hypothetical protein
VEGATERPAARRAFRLARRSAASSVVFFVVGQKYCPHARTGMLGGFLAFTLPTIRLAYPRRSRPAAQGNYFWLRSSFPAQAGTRGTQRQEGHAHRRQSMGHDPRTPDRSNTNSVVPEHLRPASEYAEPPPLVRPEFLAHPNSPPKVTQPLRCSRALGPFGTYGGPRA